jgi:hypothetical protein
MSTTKSSEEIKYHRRRFLGIATMSIADTGFGVISSTKAQPSKTAPATVPAIKPGTNASFGSLKQTEVGLPNVGHVRLVYGAQSLPIGAPVIVNTNFEIEPTRRSPGKQQTAT